MESGKKSVCTAHSIITEHDMARVSKAQKALAFKERITF